MFLTNKLFILLVICDSQESAMTIFNTLNSRGLPLSNADILKGYIYKKVKNKEKFANDWKDIETKIEESENVKDLDFLFLQYMHIIRAENEDTNTTTQGILPFFTKTDKKEYYGALQDWLYKGVIFRFCGLLAVIEIQRVGNKSFIYRGLYYWVKSYTANLKAKNKYEDLNPVISINILDFNLTENKDKPHIHNLAIYSPSLFNFSLKYR